MRAHVRGLMKQRDATAAARARAEGEAASERERDLADVRLWGAGESSSGAAKQSPGKTLEHTRARERIDAVVTSPAARKALQELQTAVHVPKGEQAFLDLKDSSERSCEALANLTLRGAQTAKLPVYGPYCASMIRRRLAIRVVASRPPVLGSAA